MHSAYESGVGFKNSGGLHKRCGVNFEREFSEKMNVESSNAEVLGMHTFSRVISSCDQMSSAVLDEKKRKKGVVHF